MPEVICNTSPLQYLHQLRQLSLLEQLALRVVVPLAVLDELDQGAMLGIDLPDLRQLPWIELRPAPSTPPSVATANLGPGESEVHTLGLQSDDPLLILDDGQARKVAERWKLPIRGTLGIVLDAKKAGLIPEVKSLLLRLQQLGFRLAPETRAAVAQLAGESPN